MLTLLFYDLVVYVHINSSNHNVNFEHYGSVARLHTESKIHNFQISTLNGFGEGVFLRFTETGKVYSV